jgi:hypothetical protein
MAAGMMGRLAVFGYASLADPASAAETLGREVPALGVCRVAGWRRRWSQGRDNLKAEKTFARADGGEMPAVCLGLNLEPAEPGDEAPNGVLLELTKAELERLDLRELRYDRIDVTDALDGVPPGIDRVIAYRAKPERYVPEPPAGAVVLASYLRTVESAFDALGPGELDVFRSSTGEVPVPTIEGVLVSDAIPPGNPRAW